MTPHRSGRGRTFTAKLELAGQQVLQTLVVHHQHDQVHAFGADLKSPTASTHGDECRGAPAVCGAATGDAAAVLTAENETGLDQVRDHDNAFGIVEDFLRYALVGRVHDLFENIPGILQALYRIFFGGCESHGTQHDQTEHQCDKRSFQWILLKWNSMRRRNSLPCGISAQVRALVGVQKTAGSAVPLPPPPTECG